MPPFDPGVTSTFYSDISYGDNNRNVMDVWVPSVALTAVKGIVLGFHGGGFKFGDKSTFYTGDLASEVTHYLNEGIAFAAVNYRLIGLQGDLVGVRKCFDDAVSARDYLLSNLPSFGVNINRMAAIGGSAGAGLCQYLAFKDTNEYLSAIGVKEIQATYDFRIWDVMFSDFDLDFVEFSLEKDDYRNLLAFLGIKSLRTIQSSNIQNYFDDINLLDISNVSETSVWLENAIQPSTEPQNINALYHHPLHAKFVREAVSSAGLQGVANIPELGVFNSTPRQDFITDNFN